MTACDQGIGVGVGVKVGEGVKVEVGTEVGLLVAVGVEDCSSVFDTVGLMVGIIVKLQDTSKDIKIVIAPLEINRFIFILSSSF